MTLDVRTIVVMLILSSVLMTVTLAVGTGTSRGRGFTRWNAGLGLYALGWLLIASRGWLPELLTMAIADAVLLTGLCLQLAAIVELSGGRLSPWLVYMPGAALCAALVPLMDHYAYFTSLASAAYTAVFFAIAGAAYQLGTRAGPARWMLAGAYAASGLFLLVRAIVVMADPQGNPGLYEPGLLHASAFIALFAATATGSVAFLLMLRELGEAEIRHLAMFDPLTALFNRRAFMDLAERELARARRARAPCAVLMMDLDFFKRVNDDYGHQAGDRVLADFAATARQSVRTEDLVGRYGGEEFCAVLPGADLAKALEIAERIRAAVAARPLAGLPSTITVSIGVVAGALSAATSLDAAIGLADKALYEAKHGGRNRVVGINAGAPYLAAAA
jgi:diguanylate cyclase (GGDEF)-like protein